MMAPALVIGIPGVYDSYANKKKMCSVSHPGTHTNIIN